MTPDEFRDAVARLRHADIVVEEWMDVDGSTVAHWASGRERIPRVRIRQIGWLLKAEEGRRKYEASGLEECEWRTERTAAFASRTSPSAEEILEYSDTIEEHQAECAVCQANDAWADTNLANVGSFPQPGWLGSVLGLFGRVPPRLWPSVLGALLLSGITALRAVPAAVVVLVGNGDPESGALMLGGGLLAAAAAGVAGAAGGLVVPVARPALRRLGAVGDYLTGILVVWTYAFAIGIVAPLAFGESLLDRSYVGFSLMYGGFLGLAGAFFYRRDNEKAKAKRS